MSQYRLTNLLSFFVLARRFGVPIYELLGGELRDKLRVYAWIGGDRPGDVEAQA